MRLNKKYMGTISLSPDKDVIAGEFSTWTITFTAGEYGIDDGGTMVVAWKSVSDWDSPQFDEPDMPGYTTVSTTGSCRVSARYSKFVRSFGNSILIDVNGGYIKKGDQIKIVLGDTSKGSLGMRAQSFCEREHEFRVFLDPCGTARYEEMPERLKVRIIPSDHHEIQAIVPGTVAVGEPFDIAIRALDEFGNPTGRYSGTISLASSLSSEGIPGKISFPENTDGVIRINGCRTMASGTSSSGMRSESTLPAATRPDVCSPLRLTGFSGATCMARQGRLSELAFSMITTLLPGTRPASISQDGREMTSRSAMRHGRRSGSIRRSTMRKAVSSCISAMNGQAPLLREATTTSISSKTAISSIPAATGQPHRWTTQTTRTPSQSCMISSGEGRMFFLSLISEDATRTLISSILISQA